MALAARIADPTTDGVVAGAGAPTVLIGGMPAALVGDMAIPSTSKPPGIFAAGSATVLINGKAALRQGDSAVNASSIVMGCPTVIIG